ncbi:MULTISPECIES: aminotransferase class IV [unclassified Streptomyces]|uniref:aminotransferase class IV n=1 Tax=unclassified Streptomyces TaxID=2593676 RepID=UPI00381E0051
MTTTHIEATSTTIGGQVLGWTPGRGLTLVDEPPDQFHGLLPAADSWLVLDGRVRALARHRERFLTACADASDLPAVQLVSFWRDMTAALPREGAWFPRVELLTADHSPRLRVRIRYSPRRTSGVRVWASGQPDPRTVPRRKGPDLDTLTGVRHRAGDQGADEAVLTSASGLVLEATSSSVLWWEDDTLCLPSPRLPVLPGVTTAIIQDHAGESGIRVLHRERTLAELAGREVWLVNALHGIRPVTSWLGPPMLAGPAAHAARWQKWLNGIAEPLPDH